MCVAEGTASRPSHTSSLTNSLDQRTHTLQENMMHERNKKNALSLSPLLLILLFFSLPSAILFLITVHR